MARIREIKGRIRAVSNIQRITKTMQMIATARFQAAQRRAVASQPYAKKIRELVSELIQAVQSQSAISGTAGAVGGGAGGAAGGAVGGGGGGVSHPLMKVPDPAVGRILLLVITSNRGLCGGYNSNILRTAQAKLRELSGKQVDLEVVGKKGLAFFKFNKVSVSNSLSQFGDRPTFDQVQELVERYSKRFIEGQYDSVQVIHMGFQSMSRQSPVVMELLPLRPPSPPSPASSPSPASPSSSSSPSSSVSASQIAGQSSYDFSPEPKAILEELLPLTVQVQLYQAFNEAIVSEQVARMIAMKSATDAAGKMKKTLTRDYNRARQAAITKELSEIIAGSAALK